MWGCLDSTVSEISGRGENSGGLLTLDACRLVDVSGNFGCDGDYIFGADVDGGGVLVVDEGEFSIISSNGKCKE